MILKIFQILVAGAGVAMSLAIFPQAVKIFKRKSAKDISLLMYCILVVGGLVWIVYGFLIKNWAIFITYLISIIANLLVLAGKIKYSK